MTRNELFVFLSIVLITFFFIVTQLSLSSRISQYIQRDVVVVSYHVDNGVPTILPTTEVPITSIPRKASLPTPTVFPTVSPTIEPTRKVEFRNTTRFNPVGIPFYKKSWYLLYRHYQRMKQNDSTSYIHFDKDSPYTFFQGETINSLFIPCGCVNLYKRQIIIITHPPNRTALKTHLRPSSVLHVSPINRTLPGFESLPLFTSDDPDIPYTVHSSNLTWLLYTPKKAGESECMDSLQQYIPLFLHSVRPLFPIDVCFLTSFEHSLIASSFRFTRLLEDLRVRSWCLRSVISPCCPIRCCFMEKPTRAR